MLTVNTGNFTQQLATHLKDKQLTKSELPSLEKALTQENISADDQKLLSKVLNKIQKKTGGTANLFNNQQLNPNELGQIERVLSKIKDQTLAQEVRNATQSIVVQPTEKNNVLKRKSSTMSPNTISFENPQKHDQKSWHITQYSDYDKANGEGAYGDAYTNKKIPEGTKAMFVQAGNSCGPTCALMILKRNGMADGIEGIADMRKKMNAQDKSVDAQEGGIGAESIAKAVNHLSEGKLVAETRNTKENGIHTPQAMLDAMREELDAGKQVVLLTQFMDKKDNNDVGSGHFVVLTDIKDDNSLVVTDPYHDASTRTFDFSEFESVFNIREAYSEERSKRRPNAYVTIAPQK